MKIVTNVKECECVSIKLNPIDKALCWMIILSATLLILYITRFYWLYEISPNWCTNGFSCVNKITGEWMFMSSEQYYFEFLRGGI